MNHKLEVGKVFSRIIEIYREQFGLLIPAALVLFVPVALVNGFLYEEGGFFFSLLASLIALVATYWYQGMVVEAARDILDGRRDYTIGSLFSSVTPVLGALIVAGILAGIGITIGLVLFIVPGLFLLTIWALIAPVIVIERTGALGSFGRSRELVKGNGWAVFGVIVLLFLATFAVRLIVGAIIGGIFDSFIGFALAELIVSVLMVPLTALAASVMYFELKGAHGEPVPGVDAAGEAAAVGAGATGGGAGAGAPAPGPEAPGSGAQMPPAPPPGSGQSPPPAPGSPPPAAPPPGGSPPAGGDPKPPSGGPQNV